MTCTGGGNIDSIVWCLVAVDAISCRRLSSFGRNFNGVCRTEGAEEGGLKIMWSWFGECFELRKDESGLMFKRCFVRRYEDSFRRDAALRESRHWVRPERRSRTGLRISRESIAEIRAGELRYCRIIFEALDMLGIFLVVQFNLDYLRPPSTIQGCQKSGVGSASASSSLVRRSIKS